MDGRPNHPRESSQLLLASLHITQRYTWLLGKNSMCLCSNGYSLYCAELMVNMKDVPSTERMVLCSKQWKMMTQKEKDMFQKRCEQVRTATLAINKLPVDSELTSCVCFCFCSEKEAV